MCRYGSITKAAEELFVSQPTISFCLKELEDEFGVKLFHRRHNRLQLTVEGQFFLDKIDYILQSVDTLTTQIKDMGKNHNHVKIAVPAMISTFLFPQMFNAFTRMYPDVELEMLETGSLQTRKLVDANSVDLGVTILDGFVTDSYNLLPLVTTELVFCVSKTHPLADILQGTCRRAYHTLQGGQLPKYRHQEGFCRGGSGAEDLAVLLPAVYHQGISELRLCRRVSVQTGGGDGQGSGVHTH